MYIEYLNSTRPTASLNPFVRSFLLFISLLKNTTMSSLHALLIGLFVSELKKFLSIFQFLSTLIIGIKGIVYYVLNILV